MGNRKGGCKAPKDLNTEMRLLIARLGRVAVDKQSQVDTLTSERERLLLRAKAAQLVLQTAEAVADLVTALRQNGQGEQLKGLAGSQLLAQVQAQLQGLRQELVQLEGSSTHEGPGRSGCDDGDSRDGASGAAAVGSCSRASAASAGTADSAALRAFAAWLPPPAPLCWTVEQALSAANASKFKGHASMVSAFVMQMVPLLSHVSTGAPDAAAARAKLDKLRSGLLAHGAAQHLTTPEARVAEAIYASYLGPKPACEGPLWEQRLGDPSALPCQGALFVADAGTGGSFCCCGGGGGVHGGGGGGTAPRTPGAAMGSASNAALEDAAPHEPPPGYWRWIVEMMRLTAEQELLIDAFMELWWERATPMWQERAELLSALQSRAQGCSGGGGGGGGGAGGGGSCAAGGPVAPGRLGDGERVVSRLEVLQSGLFLQQAIFGLAFAGGILTSWQLCLGFASAHPFVPSFLVVEQGLRELRAARAARTARQGGPGSSGLVFRAS